MDYEDMILQRQEEQEIFEDDPDMWDMLFCSDDHWWNNIKPEDYDLNTDGDVWRAFK